MSDDLKAPLLGRDGMGIAIEVRKEEDKTVRLSFPASSEAPVERWFGEEVLSHDKKSIRMDRINRGAMPVLFNHNWDEPIGIVDGARIENNRLVVDAHLFATARAQEIAAMVEGGLRNVSIGYRLHVVEEDKKAARFTATDWEPFEVSIVTVPADPSVGIGRQLGGDEFEVRMVRAAKKETVAEAVDPNPANTAASKEKARMADETNAAAGASAEPKIEVREIEKAPNGVEIEKGRVAAIRNLAKANKIDERHRHGRRFQRPAAHPGGARPEQPAVGCRPGHVEEGSIAVQPLPRHQGVFGEQLEGRPLRAGLQPAGCRQAE
jgi:HK97 family phage prohead protease